MHWTASDFRIISGMRIVGALALAATGMGMYLGNVWMAIMGLFVWAFAFPAATSLFWASTAISHFRWTWLSWKATKQPVPEIVLALASRAGVKPPKIMKVLPTTKINAAVNGPVLYVTKGFAPFMETSAGHGILAHEVGHLTRGNRDIRLTACIVAIVSAVPITALFSFPSAAFFWAAILTVGAPIMQRASWKAEYDADKMGARLTSTESVLLGFQLLRDDKTWKLDSDSHPSFSRRKKRLLEASNKTG